MVLTHEILPGTCTGSSVPSDKCKWQKMNHKTRTKWGQVWIIQNCWFQGLSDLDPWIVYSPFFHTSCSSYVPILTQCEYTWREKQRDKDRDWGISLSLDCWAIWTHISQSQSEKLKSSTNSEPTVLSQWIYLPKEVLGDSKKAKLTNHISMICDWRNWCVRISMIHF